LFAVLQAMEAAGTGARGEARRSSAKAGSRADGIIEADHADATITP